MNPDLSKAFDAIDQRFRSGNSVPIDRAWVPVAEWRALQLAARLPIWNRVEDIVPPEDLPARPGAAAPEAPLGPNQYRIRTLDDLLKVPDDRRDSCIRGLQYAFEMHQLVHGEAAASTPVGTVIWTDDGKLDVDVRDQNGDLLLGLAVNHGEPATGTED